jgi:hypothetical protein
MRHYLTYQHNVQKYFRDHCDKYDGVIIPLSIVTAFPSGTYGFIRALCSAHTDKQYAIDPRNALFQKRWNRDNVREPHKKMAASLGEPYVSTGLGRALEPIDFADPVVLEEHVRLSIEMQLQFSSRSEDARKLAKYKKLLGLTSLGSLGSPQFLIPPYYQFQTTSDQWYAISQQCILLAAKYRDGVPVWPVMHFSEWSDVDWSACHSWLLSAECKDFWYYANHFKEHEASKESLRAYRTAVELAGASGLRPNVLFGGYFAILMSYFGLQGFGNGVGYGEWRDSGYHRGGTAAKRIYILKLHRYIDSAAAQHLVERDPDYFGADTEIIAGYVDAAESLVDIAPDEAIDHFFECRRLELEFARTQPISAAIAELDETHSHLEAIGPLELGQYGHSLSNWKHAMG